MSRIIKTLSLVILLTVSATALGQTDKEKALKNLYEAIRLTDAGHFKESIKLLKEAQKLDPDKFDYPYEIAYTLYESKDYKGAIKILKKLRKHKDVRDLLYQLLGNSYDYIGKPKKALKIYDEGLKRFPNSGRLYLEKGNVYLNQEKYNKALPFYEKGIKLDPAFPSNYYRAALLYCNSSESLWGLIYGEIFMNLERNSKRTEEISKLLYDTYKNVIQFKGDSINIDLCRTIEINISKEDNLTPPFCTIYGVTLILALINEKTINLNSLDRIRQNFIKIYYEEKRNKDYPNVLFDFQKKIKDAGHFEAYNHWILMKGDEDAFDKWYSQNTKKWKDFVNWFTKNGLTLDQEHKFYRAQYK